MSSYRTFLSRYLLIQSLYRIPTLSNPGYSTCPHISGKVSANDSAASYKSFWRHFLISLIRSIIITIPCLQYIIPHRASPVNYFFRCWLCDYQGSSCGIVYQGFTHMCLVLWYFCMASDTSVSHKSSNKVDGSKSYSTVTLLARLRGLSTSRPRAMAM